ncbi:hypothetical protein QOT17_022148 [Balamuthia mandrillaris]
MLWMPFLSSLNDNAFTSFDPRKTPLEKTSLLPFAPLSSFCRSRRRTTRAVEEETKLVPVLPVVASFDDYLQTLLRQTAKESVVVELSVLNELIKINHNQQREHQTWPFNKTTLSVLQVERNHEDEEGSGVMEAKISCKMVVPHTFW